MVEKTLKTYYPRIISLTDNQGEFLYQKFDKNYIYSYIS